VKRERERKEKRSVSLFELEKEKFEETEKGTVGFVVWFCG
jgi:hypothetical protein